MRVTEICHWVAPQQWDEFSENVATGKKFVRTTSPIYNQPEKNGITEIFQVGQSKCAPVLKYFILNLQGEQNAVV